VPEKIAIDKSGANTVAIEDMRTDSGAVIELRQSKYLNNIVEQDHRAIKRSFAARASDQEGAVPLPQCPSVVRSIPVLLAGLLIEGWSIGFAGSHARTR